MLKYVDTKIAPAAIGPYSQGIILNGIAFFSGQIPLSPETGEVVGTTIEEQTEQVMQNVKALLESQGASFTDVVKTTCFLADMGDFAAFNEIYAKYFTYCHCSGRKRPGQHPSGTDEGRKNYFQGYCGSD